MLYWILAASGIPISCTIVQRVTELEKKTDEFKGKMEKFNLKIETRIGDNVKNAKIPLHELDKISPGSMIDLERDDDIFHNEFTKAINDPSLKEADDETMTEYGITDQYIGMKLRLPRGPDGESKYVK